MTKLYIILFLFNLHKNHVTIYTASQSEKENNLENNLFMFFQDAKKPPRLKHWLIIAYLFSVFLCCQPQFKKNPKKILQNIQNDCIINVYGNAFKQEVEKNEH